MTTTLDKIVAECQTLLAQCIIATNQVSEIANAIGLGYAPLNSPVFTGLPQAPTQPKNTGNASIATTAYLDRLLGVPNGIAALDNSGFVPLAQLPFSGLTPLGTWNAATNTPTLVSSTGTAGQFYVVSVAGSTTLNGISSWAVGDWALFSAGAWSKVPYVSPALVNLPLSSLAPIAANTIIGSLAGGTSSPIAMTVTQLTGILPVFTGDSGSGGVQGLVPAPFAGATGSGCYLSAAGTWTVPPLPNLSAYAPLNSPAFTGTPTVARATRNTNSTALASTSFVLNQLAQLAEVSLLQMNGTASSGTSTYGSPIDHIHPTDTSRASVAYVDASNTPSCTVAFTLLTSAPNGWLLFADQTIGNAGSSATYANANAINVFAALYAFSDANCPLLTSSGSATTRGAQGTSSTAWLAGCRITMPRALGRALAAAGAGAGLTSRNPGDFVGVETVTLDATMQASMPVSASGGVSGSFSGGGSGSGSTSTGSTLIKSISISTPTGGYTDSAPNALVQAIDTGSEAAVNVTVSVSGGISGTASVSGTATGGGLAHQNMEPTLFLKAMVKL